MRRFRVPALIPGQPVELDGARSHHLLGVLRARTGTRVLLFDGDGHQAVAVIEAVRRGRAVLVLDGPVEPRRPRWPLFLIIGLARGPAMDLAVRVATETGATAIHPFRAERSAASGDRTPRWHRIAEAAAQQCGRADVPVVRAPSSLGAILSALPDDTVLRVAVPGAGPQQAARGAAAVVIGPEGGLTAREIARCIEGGATPLGLGAWTLRVATATAVALAATAPGTP